MDFRKDLKTFEDFKLKSLELTCGKRREGKHGDFYNHVINLKESDYLEYCKEHKLKEIFLKLGFINDIKDEVDSTMKRYWSTFNQNMTFLSLRIYDAVDQEKDEELKKQQDIVIQHELQEAEKLIQERHINLYYESVQAYNEAFGKRASEDKRLMVDNFTAEKIVRYVVTGDATQLCWSLGYPSDYIKEDLQKFRMIMHRRLTGVLKCLRTEEIEALYPSTRSKVGRRKKINEKVQLHPRKIIGARKTSS